MMAHRHVPGSSAAILVLCDHASADIPPGVDLGVPEAAMASHIALDIGAGPLALAIAARLDAPAILARWSRLVVDTNRAPGHPEMAPTMSDGVAIPGNSVLDPAGAAERLALHRAFHAAVDAQIAAFPPRLIVAVHSFTPALASDPDPRPWPIAMLWNQDDRAVAPALAALQSVPGIEGPLGLNQPYTGRTLNYTMDRHAEARGIPYLGFEVRQDQLPTSPGITRWAGILVRAIGAAHSHLSGSR